MHSPPEVGYSPHRRLGVGRRASEGDDPSFRFDLDGDQSIYDGDFALFTAAYRSGGLPVTDPPGENAQAQIRYEIVPGAPSEWLLNVTVTGASNLAGYSFRVSYPHATLFLATASPDSAEWSKTC